MKWKDTGYKLVSYPVIACVTYALFIWLLFYGLPVLNTMGASMFVRDEVTIYTMFSIPFTALDTVVLIGFFRTTGKLAPRFNRWMANLPEQYRNKKAQSGVRGGFA